MVRQGPPALNEFVKSDLTLRDACATAVGRLEKTSESPRLDAELLLARAIDVPRSYLLTHPEDSLDPAARQRFFSAIDQRAAGVPLAYIVGEKEFWSLTLMVSPATLVPRPETELLVERALQLMPRESVRRVLDLGTGSGAVALAIAHERSLCHVTATDVSEAALAVASENARQLDIDNVTFVAGSWTKPVADQTFDLIVSNPPYVAAADPALARLIHEPRDALVSGTDGLDAIRGLAIGCGSILAEGGTLLLEHGADQEEAVAQILEEAGWVMRRCFPDLAGLPRVTQAVRS